MRYLSLDNITDAAAASFAGLPDARQRELVQQLVKHMHAYAKAVKLTHAEWRAGLDFLHRVGDVSTDTRSEFSLMSDVSGLSSLVDMLALADAPASATPGSCLGPFHALGSPWMDNPAQLKGSNEGTPVVLRGRVCNIDGAPLPEATLDFWQNAASGLYWQQDASQPTDNLRCQLRTDAQGCFTIYTLRVVPYQIPLDGPVWHSLVQPAGLHGWRPAHFHLIVSAPGYRSLVTEVFDETDTYLDTDAVFGVRAPLVGRYVEGPEGLKMSVEIRLAALSG